jgi:DNA gyrase/topoisomerase IV subunit B
MLLYLLRYFSLFQTHAINFIGEDKYGVYSLNGKLKNLQDLERVQDEPECKHIKNIFMALGLTCGISNAYVFDVRKLRYARVLMMLDQVLHHKHSSQTLLTVKVILILFIYFNLFINFISGFRW